jgi:hypothetical protein
MCEPRSKIITFVIHENLSFVLQAAKRAGMDDAVTITLKWGPAGVIASILLIKQPTARLRAM